MGHPDGRPVRGRVQQGRGDDDGTALPDGAGGSGEVRAGTGDERPCAGGRGQIDAGGALRTFRTNGRDERSPVGGATAGQTWLRPSRKARPPRPGTTYSRFSIF